MATTTAATAAASRRYSRTSPRTTTTTTTTARWRSSASLVRCCCCVLLFWIFLLFPNLLLPVVVELVPSSTSPSPALFVTAVEASGTALNQQQQQQQEENDAAEQSSGSSSKSDNSETPARSRRRRRRRRRLLSSWQTWLRRILGRIRHNRNSKNNSSSKFSVTVQDGFLTAPEAESLLQRYRPLLRESRHAVRAGSASDARRSPYRTSRTVRLPPLGDGLVLDVQERAVRLAAAQAAGGAERSNNNTSSSSTSMFGSVEDLQLACYGPDELYALHRDDNAAGAAQRAATVLMYLKVPSDGGDDGSGSGGGGGGGATLFTNRPLEAERDPQTRRPLQSEAAAVALFREYCRRPQRHHTVVEAVVGRAAAWMNAVYNNDTHEFEFVPDSTHGACPVTSIAGGGGEHAEKCVIQQWISRAPVRNPLYGAAAILTAGAAASFRDEALLERHSLRDAGVAAARSSLSGRTANSSSALVVERLRPSDGTLAQLIPDGPYEHLGGLRLTGGSGLSTAAPLIARFPEQWTVSFWVRNLLRSGTTVVSQVCEKEGVFTVTALASGNNNDERVDTLQLQTPSSSLSIVDADVHPPAIHFSSNADQWMWFSFSMDASSSMMRLRLFDSKGKALGQTEGSFQSYHNCLAEPNSNSTSSIVLLAPPPPPPPPPPRVEKNDEERETPAFVVARDGDGDGEEGGCSNGGTAFVQRKVEAEGGQAEETLHPPPHADVSFILFHDRILDLDEVRDLQRQARRYDINL